MVAEFVGGPWDGDLREVEDTCQELRVAMLLPFRLGTSPDACIETRTGIYKRKGTGRDFRWIGEQSW